MNSLNKYFSSKYRREQIDTYGEDTFAATCTIEYAQFKEAETQEREREPATFRDAYARQHILDLPF